MICGSGGNACYFEKVEKIDKWVCKDPSYYNIKEIIINMECGAFGDNGVIDFAKSKFDKAIDEESLFPNSFT